MQTPLAIGYGMWGGRTAVPEEEPVGTATTTETTAGTWMSDSNPAVVAAGKHLVNEIKAGEAQIALKSVTAAEWPNGCLGLAKEGELCTQATVPGYEIRFIARGVEFIYRTNMDGTNLRMQTPFDVKG